MRDQLRASADEAPDALLQGYVDAAIAHVEQHCDRKIVDGTPADDGEMALTPDVEQAVRLLVGHWYSNREAVVVGEVSSQLELGVERLLQYRKRY
nr:head-tail connector protein [Luteibacter sp. SG786]